MAKMWAGRFSKEVDSKVNDFNSSISFDQRMYKQDITGSIAHCTMLAKVGILTDEEKEKIISALKNICDDISNGALEIDYTAEDIHMFVEQVLTNRIGDLGKKLHTARSRNDQVALDIRLYLRDEMNEILSLLKDLCNSMTNIAKNNLETVMPGYTHLQRAQPITFAHHICAYVEMILRDMSRIKDATKRMNYCPLGSGALATTTYDIDRYMTDAVFKSNVGLYRSLAINVIYVVVNAVSGYIYQTYWFVIFAVYYAIVAMMRFLLVRYVMKNPIGDNHLGELKRARMCGYILMTVNLALSGAVLMMVFFNRGFQYQGFLIYVIALYTFYITVTAVIDMVKYRKYKSPILSITKVIKMASALFSMLFLETAMFAQFGADTSPEVKRLMIMLTGAGISIVVVSMAIYMIVRTTKEIKEIKVTRSETENGKS